MEARQEAQVAPSLHDKRCPGESEVYRAARDKLLAAEMDLRKQVETVAAQRRALPPGGRLKEDYLFEEGAADLTDQTIRRETRFSELFVPGKGCLAVYSFMYAPDSSPCPGCTALLDCLDNAAPHVVQRVNLAVVAKAPLDDIRAWARGRGWRHLRLLSSGANGYNADYHAEAPDGSHLPVMNVFRKTGDGIYHRYASELLYAPAEPGQNPRHLDLLWPVWNLFDMTPEGRGSDWFPQNAYD